jgi:hypothetical protein
LETGIALSLGKLMASRSCQLEELDLSGQGPALMLRRFDGD